LLYAWTPSNRAVDRAEAIAGSSPAEPPILETSWALGAWWRFCVGLFAVYSAEMQLGKLVHIADEANVGYCRERDSDGGWWRVVHVCWQLNQKAILTSPWGTSDYRSVKLCTIMIVLQVYQVLPWILVGGTLLYVLNNVLRFFQNENARKERGCGAIPRYPHREPILGLDIAIGMAKALKGNYFLEWLNEIHRNLPKTFVVNFVGSRFIYTIEPEVSSCRTPVSDHCVLTESRT
jgi:hypothetical protein